MPKAVFKLSIALFALLVAGGSASWAAPLPSPADLQTEVDFWKRVFAEVPSTQALVHDNRYLGVVYEVVEIPPGSTYRQQRRLSERIRNKYRDLLTRIADGNRQSLSAEEKRVLSLWPDNVTNDELRQASRRVRFQGGLSDRFVEGLVRSGSWRDYIDGQLNAAGVPGQLVALPHVESSFNPRAGSSAGAVGLWQFTRPTGRRFMQIDHVVDERRDPFRSSDAAAQLLSYNYSVLNSWPLAITAYNHGVAGMRRAVKQMGTDDIESIVHNYSGKRFGFASRNFYVAFLAASAVDTDYDAYFGPVNMNPPANDIVVKLPDYMEFDTLSRAFGISEASLRQYNPALMPAVVDGSKYVPRGYQLRLPDGSAAAPDATLAALPSSDKFSEQTPDMYHKVQSGDSLSVIAVRYKTSVRELKALNNLSSSHYIRVGQVLRLPYSDSGKAITSGVYTVRSGDTLGEIAQRAGTTRSQLVRINNLSNGDRIYVGQKLVLNQVAPVAEVVAEPVVAAAEVAEATDTSAVVEDAVEDGEGLPVASVDPSNYEVADDGSVEVQASETLGHYAEWLDIPTQALRDLNGLSYRQPLVIGSRVKLKFANVSVEEFEQRRSRHHQELQDAFFVRYRITDTKVHKLKSGESVWVLNQRYYKVPEWLLRQYNPDIDLSRVRPGAKIVFPQIERVDADA